MIVLVAVSCSASLPERSSTGSNMPGLTPTPELPTATTAYVAVPSHSVPGRSASSPTPVPVAPRPQSDPTLPQWAAAPGTTACLTVRDTLPPAGATCVTVAQGDLDGDGVPDRAVVWGDPAPPPPHGGQQRWHLVAVTVRGGTYETLVETPFFEAVLRGIIDVNADGRGQILVHVDRGASTERWRAFALVDGALRQIQAADRIPLEILMFGSGGRSSGFDCVQDDAGARLLSLMSYGLRNTATDALVFDWTARNYQLRGAQVTLVGEAGGTVSAMEMNDPGSDFNKASRRVGRCGLRLT